MNSKDLKKAFYDAKKELEQLEAELPNFEQLLADNTAEEVKARGSKNYYELTQAKNRVMAARELLEQHQADIEAAKAEAQRLATCWLAILRGNVLRHADRADGHT